MHGHFSVSSIQRYINELKCKEFVTGKFFRHIHKQAQNFSCSIGLKERFSEVDGFRASHGAHQSYELSLSLRPGFNSAIRIINTGKFKL